MKRIVGLTLVMVFLLVEGAIIVVNSKAGESKPLAVVTARDRCPVCGMFVSKYPTWVAQIRLSDDRVEMFDGPKDMLAYYMSPKDFGAGDATVGDVVVRDYYSQEWIDGEQAFYVMGSDVYGPMGNEFVPFETMEAAKNFAKDHRGKRVLLFDEIDNELVQSIRKGHKMMGGMKK
ncbi:nitrous oxide reductase accessory protein NosL [Desulfosediminicola ganghwensis]|uniref:nitrous oxide reductase accessory protein NosL n=1 Tax=Desulfosediminicola ganghwensis TaxID=2569540 RepID=UPI0010AB9D51|nr:nitrous oxide reductase accessory protein NosL [Desulfosediminicola ganghwensis]